MLHKVYPQPANMYPKVWSVYPKAWDRQTKTGELSLRLYLPTFPFILRKFFANSLDHYCPIKI